MSSSESGSDLRTEKAPTNVGIVLTGTDQSQQPKQIRQSFLLICQSPSSTSSYIAQRSNDSSAVQSQPVGLNSPKCNITCMNSETVPSAIVTSNSSVVQQERLSIQSEQTARVSNSTFSAPNKSLLHLTPKVNASQQPEARNLLKTKSVPSQACSSSDHIDKNIMKTDQNIVKGVQPVFQKRELVINKIELPVQSSPSKEMNEKVEITNNTVKTSNSPVKSLHPVVNRAVKTSNYAVKSLLPEVNNTIKTSNSAVKSLLSVVEESKPVKLEQSSAQSHSSKQINKKQIMSSSRVTISNPSNIKLQNEKKPVISSTVASTSKSLQLVFQGTDKTKQHSLRLNLSRQNNEKESTTSKCKQPVFERRRILVNNLRQCIQTYPGKRKMCEKASVINKVTGLSSPNKSVEPVFQGMKPVVSTKERNSVQPYHLKQTNVKTAVPSSNSASSLLKASILTPAMRKYYSPQPVLILNQIEVAEVKCFQTPKSFSPSHRLNTTNLDYQNDSAIHERVTEINTETSKEVLFEDVEKGTMKNETKTNFNTSDLVVQEHSTIIQNCSTLKESSSDQSTHINSTKITTIEVGQGEAVKQDKSKLCTSKDLDTTSNVSDSVQILVYEGGTGTSSGSDFKYCTDELDTDGTLNEVINKNSVVAENKIKVDVINTKVNYKSSVQELSSQENVIQSKGPISKLQEPSSTLFQCEYCKCYGMIEEFIDDRFCSKKCVLSATKKTKKCKRTLRKKKKEYKKEREFQNQEAERTRDKQLSYQNLPENKDKLMCSPVSTKKNTKRRLQDLRKEKSFWQKGKKCFSWRAYLSSNNSQAVPDTLFRAPYPARRNRFKIGMKLEGIDPLHQASYCVLTVADVQGYRIRLHFDGYPEMYDFWKNADSTDIFPVGWCEKNNRQLLPPGDYKHCFRWSSYLKESGSEAAPSQYFCKTKSSICPTGFRRGSKLEAVDRQNMTQICVATITDVRDNHILIHLDGRDETCDYWTDLTSPYIHPVGCCEKHGFVISSPSNYQSFLWTKYLEETKSLPVPARAFKQRQPYAFQKDMKLECVDQRVPMLIRVATIDEVSGYHLKIKFDGWADEYSFWLDDDSPDIHPVGWCQKTGHPLELPPNPFELNAFTKCQIFGCQGKGHVVKYKYNTHHTAGGCPYVLDNWNKYGILNDRLCHGKTVISHIIKSKPMLKPDTWANTKEVQRSVKKRKYGRVFNEEFIVVKNKHLPPNTVTKKCNNSKKSLKHRNIQCKELEKTGCDTKKRKLNSNENKGTDSSNKSTITGGKPKVNLEEMRNEIHNSIINPGYEVDLNKYSSCMWVKHTKFLHKFVDNITTKDVLKWSKSEVSNFVKLVTGSSEVGTVFQNEDIDGQVFLMMSQEDIVKQLGIKLGAAIKIYNSILLLRVKGNSKD